MFYMHATYRAKVLQVHYDLKRRIFHTLLSQQGCEKEARQLFIRTHIHKVLAAVCTISRTAGPSIFVSPILKSPRKIPTVPAQREDYCFPICWPVRTQPYQSKPGQLLFHILLMYWKAFHSRLLLTAGPEKVSVPNSTMENNQAFLLD